MLLEEYLEIIESLKSGDILEIKQSIDHFNRDNRSDLSKSSHNKKFKEELEKSYYKALSNFLASMRFEEFRQLFNYSDKLEIFVDVKKIPLRFKIISDLHLLGIQSGQIGNIFKIIKIFNEYNLFERDFTSEELELIETIKKDKMLVSNLKDLFGKVSNSLIFYACKIIPKDLYLLYKNSFADDIFARNYNNLGFLLKYFNRYSVYGLSVEKLGKVQDFINCFEWNYTPVKNKKVNEDPKLITFRFKSKTHLVSINNILNNYDKIIGNKERYKFYSLSMVLLGGLGPQGHGFTYSTPKGEVIEICSDIKENDAIIIKYKQFLKQQFLARLRKEMTYKCIDDIIIQKIINYLLEIINDKEIINYYKKETILKQINYFLSENLESYYNSDVELQDLKKKISNAIKIILRPIKMIDQFKCRMDLVDNDKIRSEDIAKLTSLRGKSHFDVLRERYFFQNEIKWFFKDYAGELLKLESRF